MLALGVYLDVPSKLARARREEARQLLAQGTKRWGWGKYTNLHWQCICITISIDTMFPEIPAYGLA